VLKSSVTVPVFVASVSVEPCAEPVIVPPDFIKAPALATLVASVTSALASIPSSFELSAEVKLISVKPPSPTLYEVMVFHAEPVYAFKTLLLVLKYKSPAVKASPSLSTDGSLDLAPR